MSFGCPSCGSREISRREVCTVTEEYDKDGTFLGQNDIKFITDDDFAQCADCSEPFDEEEWQKSICDCEGCDCGNSCAPNCADPEKRCTENDCTDFDENGEHDCSEAECSC